MDTFCFIPNRLEQNNLFELSLNFANSGNYSLSFEHIKTLISTNSHYLVDIFIVLYHHLNLKDDINIRFIIAKIYFSIKDYENTYQELFLVLLHQPTHTESLQLLFMLYQLDFRKQELAILFEEYFTNAPSNLFLIEKMPIIYLNENKFDKLIDFYIKRINQEPKQLYFYDQLASLYLKTEQFQKVRSTYTKLLHLNSEFIYGLLPKFHAFISKNPDIIEIHFLLLDIYIHKCDLANILNQFDILINKPDQSLELQKYSKKLLSTYPDNCDVLRSISLLYLKTKKYTECVFHLQQMFSISSSHKNEIFSFTEKILKENPSHALAKLLLCELYYNDQNGAAYVKILTDLISENYPDSNEILALINRLENCRWLDPSFYFYLKTFFHLHHKDDQFNSFLNKITDTEHKKLISYKTIQYYLSNKMSQKALNTIQAIIPEQVYDVTLHNLIKELHDQVIIDDIQKLESHESNYSKSDTSRLFLRLGLLYLRKGSLEKAIHFFQKISSNHILFDFVQLLLARCFFEQGRFDLVVHICEPFNTRNTLNEISCIHSIYFLLGCSYIHQGFIQKGIAYFEKISVSNQSFPYLNQLLTFYKKIACNNQQSPYLTAIFFNNSFYMSTFYDFEISNDIYCQDLCSDSHKKNQNAISLMFRHSFILAKQEFESLIVAHSDYRPAQFNYFIVLLILDEKISAKKQLNYLKNRFSDFVLLTLFEELYNLYINHCDNYSFAEINNSLSLNDPSYLFNKSQYFLNKQNIKSSTDQLNSYRLAIYYPFIQRYYCYLESSSLDIYYWTKAKIPNFETLIQKYSN